MMYSDSDVKHFQYICYYKSQCHNTIYTVQPVYYPASLAKHLSFETTRPLPAGSQALIGSQYFAERYSWTIRPLPAGPQAPIASYYFADRYSW